MTHDYGPGNRQRGNDYSIYSFDRTPDGARFYTSGYVRPGDATIRQGDDEVIISPPGDGRGRACRGVEVTYSGVLRDAVLDMLSPPERPYEPGARPAPLSRLLYP